MISKGAPDVLLGRCTRARVGMDVVALDDAIARAHPGRCRRAVRRGAAHAGRGLPPARRRTRTRKPREPSSGI